MIAMITKCIRILILCNLVKKQFLSNLFSGIKLDYEGVRGLIFKENYGKLSIMAIVDFDW